MNIVTVHWQTFSKSWHFFTFAVWNAFAKTKENLKRAKLSLIVGSPDNLFHTRNLSELCYGDDTLEVAQMLVRHAGALPRQSCSELGELGELGSWSRKDWKVAVLPDAKAMMASLYSERAKACMRLKDWRGASYWESCKYLERLLKVNRCWDWQSRQGIHCIWMHVEGSERRRSSYLQKPLVQFLNAEVMLRVNLCHSEGKSNERLTWICPLSKEQHSSSNIRGTLLWHVVCAKWCVLTAIEPLKPYKIPGAAYMVLSGSFTPCYDF